ncbi:hypothetical protein J6590_054212 [Homalodisca vitripennis]|nr:hypothetical protein J6590_054212 [Homalodisca vitripennis]
MFKLGAKLLSVTSDTLTPPGTCTIAGSNDVAAGEHATLLKHLEQRIAAKLSSSRIIVSTLPHHHDLVAYLPVNGHTRRESYDETLPTSETKVTRLCRVTTLGPCSTQNDSNGTVVSETSTD